MRVLNVAYPLLSVGPGSGGGAEQILYLLDQGLMQKHFDSLVIAADGSQITGSLRETPSASDNITEAERAEAQNIHRRTIETLVSSEEIDLIHFHGLDFRAYVPETAIPKIATLHLPIDWYEAGALDKNDVHLVAVSETQARSARHPSIFRVVPNGVDTSKYALGASNRDSLLWLGRVCPEKGTHVALEVARKLDLPLTIAGPVHPFEFHRNYFRREVQPLLDGKRVYIGPVDLKEKSQLLSSARALLIPSLAAETSSLVAMEAASSGTPVVAFRSGALPEVVQHELTGFVVDDAEGMAAALKRIGGISPARCREYAVRHFSSERMLEDYIRLYRDLVQA